MTIIAAPLALPACGRKTVRVGISMTGSSPCCRGAWAGQRRRICKSSSLAGDVVSNTGSFPSTVKKGDAAFIWLWVRAISAGGEADVVGAVAAELLVAVVACPPLGRCRAGAGGGATYATAPARPVPVTLLVANSGPV